MHQYVRMVFYQRSIFLLELEHYRNQKVHPKMRQFIEMIYHLKCYLDYFFYSPAFEGLGLIT